MAVTGFYAGLLTLLFLVLSFRTIGARRAARVEIGDGDDKQLLRRMRVHANFAEYTPFALVLMVVAESLETPAVAMHTIGGLLLAGRVVHAIGLSQTPHNMAMRVGGMMATFAALAIAALACMIQAVPALF